MILNVFNLWYYNIEMTTKIQLVFPENLLKSLNKIQYKQNYELLKVVSEEKLIPLTVLSDFLDDQPKKFIKLKWISK